MSEGTNTIHQAAKSKDDIVQTKFGPQRRSAAEAQEALTPPKPKTGTNRVTELQSMHRAGKLTNEQLTAMTHNELYPQDTPLPVPTLEASKAKEAANAKYNELAEVNDSFVDQGDSISESMLAGRSINPDSIKAMQDKMVQTMNIGKAQGYDVDNDPHFINMRTYFNELRGRVRESNAMRRIGG